MKKLISLLLSLLCLLGLTACSADDFATAVFLFAGDSSAEEVYEEDSEETPDTSDPVLEEEGADVSADAAETTTESEGTDTQTVEVPEAEDYTLDEEGDYTTSEDVALYIATYNHLPDNFMTKKEARELGWNGGGLDDYAYGMCIGGDYFGNNEGLLPRAKGRTYHECDINTLHANKRGAERIVYSNDGLVYYSDDHYETFTLLYGEE